MDEQRTAQVWDLATDRPLPTFNGVFQADWSEDGTWVLTMDKERTAQVWNLAKDRPLATFDRISKARLSRDGTRMVTVDEAVKVWDVATGRLLATWTADTNSLSMAEFSPDGTRVLMSTTGGRERGGMDLTMQIWDVHPETRTPVEIAAVLRCLVPWRLDEGLLRSTTPDATACLPPSPAR